MSKAVPAVLPVRFIKEVTAELRKVEWPSRAQTIKLTVVVIVVSVGVALFIGGLDIFFLNATSLLFTR